jgi:hypothetical protein
MRQSSTQAVDKKLVHNLYALNTQPPYLFS